MVLKEIMAVYTENHTKLTTILWAKFRVLILKAGGTCNYHCGLKV
jgi:hypothetical protein